MKRLALFALATASLVACGDDGGGTPVDAATDTQIVDVPIDTPPATYSGSITVLEAAVLNPGTTGTFFGQGPQVSISFTDSVAVPGPLMEEMPGTPLGCKVWEFNPTQTAAAVVGNDEGSVAITLTGGAQQHTVPTCAYQAGAGYLCRHMDTAGTGGIVAMGAMGAATLTVTNGAYSAMNSSGKYVNIAGAVMAANNGTFPIAMSTGANTIVYINPAAANETLPGTSTHINLAGVGPIPNRADPGFLENDNAASIVLTSGGGAHFTTFTSTTGASTIGDDFVLNANGAMNTAETIKLNAIPRDGLAFTMTCDAASCPGGSASGMVLNIVTTDGTVPANPQQFFVMPPPTTKRVQVRCAVLQGAAANGSTITVPATYMARIMTSGATRIQASLIRGHLMSGGPTNVSVVSGHALVGFTTP